MRAAEAVSAWTGRVSRRLIRNPERVASAATSSERSSSSRTSRASEAATAPRGSAVSTRAAISPEGTRSGRTET